MSMVAVQALGLNSDTGKYEVLVRGNKRNETGEITRAFKTEVEAEDYAASIKSGQKRERTLERQPLVDTFGFAPKPFNPLEEYVARGKDIVGWAGTGFAPRNDYDKASTGIPLLDVLKKIVAAGCDMPEQGGINGNIKVGRKDRPNPFILEERPTTTDWRTGDRVYTDRLPRPFVCYMA